MIKALSYYEKYDSWMVEDISSMMKDDKFFDLDKKIPKEEFFKYRSKQLKKYFKSLLNRQLAQDEITVELG